MNLNLTIKSNSANSKPGISILMPVYNAEPFLEDTIESIREQSLDDWELIAVNDFSSDRSLQILKAFEKKDARIKALDNPTKGIINALKTAYKASTGSMITRMDADDLMHSDKLSLMSEKLQHHGTGTLVTGLVHYFSEKALGEGFRKYEKWLNGLSLNENNFDEIYKECVIPSPCWLCFRQDLDQAGAFESTLYPEDYDLCFRFKNAGLKIRSVPSVIHYWRDHPGRTSRTDDNYADNSFINLKLHHFIQSDLDKTKKLVLWGAGRKAKKIAQNLQGRNLPFDWVCENEKKTGKSIYGVEVKDASKYAFKEEVQVIIAVAQRGAKVKIKRNLLDSGNNISEGALFFFC